MSNTSIPSGGLRTEQRLGRRSGRTAEAETREMLLEQNRTEGEWKRFGDGTGDEKALASRPPCGGTVEALCGPACSAAPASPDQGFTVRRWRWSTLETAGGNRRRGLGLGAA